MPNISRPRVAPSTSDYRDVHDDGGLKPAEKRRVGLLEDRSADFEARIKKNDDELLGLHKFLLQMEGKIIKIRNEHNTLSTAYEDTRVEVASLNTNLENLSSEQGDYVPYYAHECELTDVHNRISGVEGDLQALSDQVTTVESQVNSINEHVERNEEWQETTSKRLKVSEESYQSIRNLVGPVHPLGPSLAQHINSQNSTIAAIKAQSNGSLATMDVLSARLDAVYKNTDTLFNNVSRLFGQYKDVACRAGNIPNLQSRTAWLENQLEPMQRRLATCIRSNNERWDAWRPRIRALEDNQQPSQQVVQSLTTIQDNVAHLDSNINQMGAKLQSLEDSLHEGQIRSCDDSILVQTIKEQVQDFRHQMIDLEKRRRESEEGMRQKLVALQEEFTTSKQSQAKVIEHLKEQLGNVRDSAKANHLANPERFTALENQQAKETQIITYGQAPTTDQPPIYRNGYVDWLRGLDFRLPDGMKSFKDRLVRMDNHMLFSCEGQEYYLKRTGRFTLEPRRAERDQRGLPDDDAYEAEERHYFEYAYREIGFEAIHKSTSSRDGLCPPPRYLVHLGEVYIHGRQHGASHQQVASTGFHLFMDIAMSEKPLWLIFSREASDGTSDILGDQWKMFGLLANEPFDAAMVAESIHDWNIKEACNYDEPRLDFEKVQTSVKKSAQTAGTVFTKPHLNSLFQTLEDGWSGFSNSHGAPVS